MAVKVNIEKNFRDFSLKVDFEGQFGSHWASWCFR